MVVIAVVVSSGRDSGGARFSPAAGARHESHVLVKRVRTRRGRRSDVNYDRHENGRIVIVVIIIIIVVSRRQRTLAVAGNQLRKTRAKNPTGVYGFD